MDVPSFPADAPLDALTPAFEEAGCLVVTGLVDPERRAAIRDELAPHMERARVIQEDDPDEFYPGRTRRVTALLARSPTVTDDLLAHPVTKRVCDDALLPNGEFGWQLHVTAALEVGPGARDQVLHREEDPFSMFPVPRPNLILATMWAVSDFSADNGGTQLVPGSHRWPADRVAEPQEVVRAEMSKGSVLVWLGSTLHGAGANVTDGWRYGVIITYSLGWLRQEENQHLSMPLTEAMALPEAVQQRLGFGMNYNDGLGFYDPSVLSEP